MWIKMLSAHHICTDGFKTLWCEKDKSYDLPDMAARMAIRSGIAVEVTLDDALSSSQSASFGSFQ